ncbi:hypothetical protein FRUB_03595 [Fimbriiglobus ruber]|uniref:SGNH hydrolase-type esterase domain-containing protein n=1 Tax=Fimbriiglobus ruber TaxID=1908690 RepID=A0A225E1S6_9BACT|nr:hypothetical protein FRUB_03595 [Fimbriiglobus ruber]
MKQNPSAKDCVAFVGSSTIRMWDVKKSFPDMNVVNLGFGGSEIRDSTHFAPRILLPLDPKAIVFYAGDNDLASGRKPAQVRDDFREFVGVVRAKLPTTPILFLCVKPSIQRWSQFEKQKEANALVKALCSEGSHLVYVDLIPGILGTDGKPKAELFAKDGLHLNPKGYEVLNAEVKAFFSRR